MNNLSAKVQAQLRSRYDEIVALTDAFCNAHLDSEFRSLCRKLAATASEQGIPITSGKAAGWAAGIVAAIGYANFLGDPSQPFHMTTDEMAKKIGVSPATLHAKLKLIRDHIGIDRWDSRFSTRQVIDRNPLTWMLSVNGFLMDIRTAPRGAQEEAFRKGLIPYIPADGPPPEDSTNSDEETDRPPVGKKRKPAGKATRSKARAASAGQTRVYTLDVFLLSGPITEEFARKNKSVERTIQIRGDQTLEDLHHAIFDAFGRDDEHMYEFQFGKRPMDPKGPRYVLPMAGEDDSGPPIAGTVDRTTIDDLDLKVGKQFGYWFDFGDDWHHQINVAEISDGPLTGRYPRVTKRIGANPPQYIDWDEEE